MHFLLWKLIVKASRIEVTRPATLQPEAPSEEAVRREHEAMEIILLAKDLLDSTKLLTFFETIVTVEADPVRAFQVRQVYSNISLTFSSSQNVWTQA